MHIFENTFLPKFTLPLMTSWSNSFLSNKTKCGTWNNNLPLLCTSY